MIAFRGSQTELDFIIDEDKNELVSCSTVFDFDCDGNVVFGYSFSYLSIKEAQDYNQMTLIDHLFDLNQIYNINYVLLTGHSKGGVEASLNIIDLLSLNLFFEIHITTFGIPSFGDENFANFWDNFVNPTNNAKKITATWHYHQDSIGHSDVVVFRSIESEGRFPFKYQSRFFDRICNSDEECHRLLLYPQITKKREILINTPIAGYYFVGSDPLYYGYSSDYYLTSFAALPMPTATATSSKSRTPSMFSSRSRSLSRTPSRSITPSNFHSRSPTQTATATRSHSLSKTISGTRTRSPTPSRFSSHSPSLSAARSHSSSPSFNSSSSPTRSHTPTKTTFHPSLSPSISLSSSPSFTPFFSESSSPTPFLTTTRSLTRSPSFTPTLSRTYSLSATHSPIRRSKSNSRSHSSTPSHTRFRSRSRSRSHSSTPSHTPHRSRTPSRTPQRNFSFPLLSFNFCLFSFLLFFFAL